jgi:uncharacterized damage-inducible protein DinB
MRTRRTDKRTTLLLHALDEAYGKAAWHGTNLRGSLRGVSAAASQWRPAAGRHNIRELVVHAAYWKYRVRQRLTGEKASGFPLNGNNWFELSPVSESAWRAEKDLLAREHRALRKTVAAFPASRLDRILPGTNRRTALREIAGIALHDVYHTGQIQLLKAQARRGRQR